MVGENNTQSQSTRWLYSVEYHNTVFGSKQSAICAQAVYFLLQWCLV